MTRWLWACWLWGCGVVVLKVPRDFVLVGMIGRYKFGIVGPAQVVPCVIVDVERKAKGISGIDMHEHAIHAKKKCQQIHYLA